MGSVATEQWNLLHLLLLSFPFHGHGFWLSPFSGMVSGMRAIGAMVLLPHGQVATTPP